MEEFVLRDDGLTDVKDIVIPHSAEEVNLSGNNLTKLPLKFFHDCKRLWNIYLDRNRFSNINFLNCFMCLNVLDLRNNNIRLADLFSLRLCTIVHLLISGNDIFKDPNFKPLLILAIIPNIWILDNEFVTDFTREVAEKIRRSSTFYEDTRNVEDVNTPRRFSNNQVQKFIATLEYDINPEVFFVSSRGRSVVDLTNRPQRDRLDYLCKYLNYKIPEGEFIDYFGLALGIMSFMWFDQPVDIIPRSLCRGYWYKVQGDIMKMNQWELFVVLHRLVPLVEPRSDVESELWYYVGCTKFVEKGRLPLPGSTSRMLLTAFFVRAVSKSDVQLKTFDDLKIYFKYRKSCGFTSNEDGLDVIHSELIAEFKYPSGSCPYPGDPVSVVHPLTGVWINAEVSLVKRGRVFIKLNAMIIQLPLMSCFWDCRGYWKEAIHNVKRHPKTAREKNILRSLHTFITASETHENNDIADKENVIEPSHPTFLLLPPISLKVTPDSKTTFLQIGREVLKSSKFIDRTIRPVETFRGIVDPPYHKPKMSPKTPIKLSVNHFIEDVVNIQTYGKEIAPGKKLRKFQVKTRNSLTNKSKYIWVHENEITKNDLRMLLRMYKSKLSKSLNDTSLLGDRHKTAKHET